MPNLSIGNFFVRARSCVAHRTAGVGICRIRTGTAHRRHGAKRIFAASPSTGVTRAFLFFAPSAGRVQSSRPLSSVANSLVRMPAISPTRAPRHSCSLRMSPTPRGDVPAIVEPAPEPPHFILGEHTVARLAQAVQAEAVGWIGFDDISAQSPFEHRRRSSAADFLLRAPAPRQRRRRGVRADRGAGGRQLCVSSWAQARV